MLNPKKYFADGTKLARLRGNVAEDKLTVFKGCGLFFYILTKLSLIKLKLFETNLHYDRHEMDSLHNNTTGDDFHMQLQQLHVLFIND